MRSRPIALNRNAGPKRGAETPRSNVVTVSAAWRGSPAAASSVCASFCCVSTSVLLQLRRKHWALNPITSTGGHGLHRLNGFTCSEKVPSRNEIKDSLCALLCALLRRTIVPIIALLAAFIGDENARLALPPSSNGKGRAMKHRRSEPFIFDERLNAEKARIRAELECANPGQQRDVLECKLRQIETALHIDSWVSSAGLQPPRLTLG